jgi:two-component system cell cycle response regulator
VGATVADWVRSAEPEPMGRDATTSLSQAAFRGLAYGLLALSLLLLADSVLSFAPSSWGGALHNYGYTTVSSIAAVVVFGRVALVRRHRRGWLLFAVGLGLLCLGDFYYTTVVVVQAEPPFPSFADVLYLMGYPILAAGLGVLLWSRLRHPPLSMWLDAAIGVLAILMLGTWLLLDAITGTTGTTLQVIVSLAYPLADLVLLSMIAAVLALTGARLDRQLIGVVLAVSAISVADVAFFYGTAMGTWSDSSPIALLWPLGGALFAVAAWAPSPSTRVAPLMGPRALVLPSAFALTIIGCGLTDPPRMSVLIGGAGLLVLVARMLVGVRENTRLVDRLSLDPLTGVGNRGRLSADLARAIAFDRPTTLVLADLDGFKLYNDAFGHPAGDAMLRRLTGALADAVGVDHAYRIGGDEFCVLLDGTAAGTVAEREQIVAALSERGEGFNVGVSLGTAELPTESRDPEEAIQLADQRMYATKDNRRDNRRTHDAHAVLIEAQREREPDLGEHVDGVARLAARVGERMGLLPGEVAMLERAAELHDIGKIAIPDSILEKPEPLSPEEWRFMRQHTVLGERILRSADSLAPVAKIVRSTHERFDGGGYPDGLAGEEIPLASRIISACDAFHAMVSERPYSHSKQPETALAELRECSGSQFDSKVVAVVCELLGKTERTATVPQPPLASRGVLIPSTGGLS